MKHDFHIFKSNGARGSFGCELHIGGRIEEITHQPTEEDRIYWILQRSQGISPTIISVIQTSQPVPKARVPFFGAY